MRKLLFVFLVASLLLSACAGTQETETAVEEMYSVKIVQWPGPEGDAMQKVVDYFNENLSEKAGYKVELLLFGRDQMTQKQEAIMAAGSAEADIFFIASRQFGKYVSFIEPLDKYMADEAVNIWGATKDEFMPSAVQGVTWFDGSLLGAPRDISAHYLYYRQDYIDQLLSDPEWQETYKRISLEQMGVEMTPKPPAEWTWDDYTAASYFFTREYNPDSPTSYGNYTHGKVLGPTAFLWSNAFFGYGGDWFDKDGNPSFNNEAAEKAINIWKTFFEKGLTPPSSVNGEYPECNEAMMAGEVALAVHWNAAFGTLDGDESPVKGKFAITAPPAGPEGRFVYNHTLAYAMNKASQHKEETANFMLWLYTLDAGRKYAEVGGIPPMPKVLEETGRADFAIMADIVDKYGKALPTTAGIIEVMTCEALTNAWSGFVSVEETLEIMQSQAEAELANWSFD